MSRISLFFIFVAVLLASCGNPGTNNNEVSGSDTIPSGKLIIFHAGSLSYPLKIVCDSFRNHYPQVEILTEAAGSKDCARKISDLDKPCDVMLSADYKVIEDLLIPEHADWCIKFASNEMAIVYTGKSKYKSELTAANWPEILLRDDVTIARSDPDSDPCGVRAVLTMQLAEKHYAMPGLTAKLTNKNRNYIRPKETDLLALLETRAVDYIFLYRSVAEQHNLKYLVLPDEVNLKSEKLKNLYATVSIETIGKKPGEKRLEHGEPMTYGITIPRNHTNYQTALAFVDFLLKADKGMAIMEANGQPSLVPAATATYNRVPEKLKMYALQH